MADERPRDPQGRQWGTGGQWIVGLVLVIVGVVLLLQTYGNVSLQNWWALFILIPAFSSLATGYHQYRLAGRLNRGAAGSLAGGVILLLLTAVFLFNLDFGKIWPLFLILAGLGILLGWRSHD
jgi:hypothetical protein